MAAWHERLEELLRTRRPALVAYAALLTGDRGEAEDLVHDALVRTFARPRRFPSLNAADAYVRRAIATTYVDHGRARGRWLTLLPRLAGATAATEADVAGRLDLRAALARLPRRQRACVVLRFYEDLTVPDIADALGVSDGAVKRYLSDGVGHLGALLGVPPATLTGDVDATVETVAGRPPDHARTRAAT
ncbi:SigE family RNA polymerase sigma factor [Actinotalea fermentans]|uniref:RNA polymerase subunit sigma-24 n=1 Tax=Actinotalea fermentans TaxID=43671 RepID=A0A511YXZ2_9CELL|nr:SigE family RNA polymerase sigma factor [Actinotalea fermentans]KGM14664.1 hypothetical protein N867_17875 [Actinotalea fermentans ATCC 43279 = JCM 9966 = DSM 3133]GEN80048.1 RNA polymerase subunit sigma-24 [Actinotalea fermentans]